MNNVEKYSVLLCDALYMSMKLWTLRLHESAAAKGESVDYHINKIEEINEKGVDSEYYLESGRKYYKLIHKDGNRRSVHCFINKTTGDVLKSASWNAPAKGVRYNLLDDNSRELCYSNCDAFGSYLYLR
jgi:hypothetical protein